MGGSQILYKQYIKGLLYLSAQIAYIVYMLMFGFSSLCGLVTLGTQEQTTVYDPELGFNVTVAYEAAKIDGAGPFKMVMAITLPQICRGEFQRRVQKMPDKKISSCRALKAG